MRAKDKEKVITEKKLSMQELKAMKLRDENDSRGFSFPKAKYIKKIKFIVPGPGQYKIPTSFDYISNLTREKGSCDPKYRYV